MTDDKTQSIQLARAFEAGTGMKLILSPVHRALIKELGWWKEIEPYVLVSEYLQTV